MKNQNGLTMIEVIAVILILSLLTISLYRGMQSPLEESRQTDVQSSFRVLKKTIDSFVIENGNLPDMAPLIASPSDVVLRDKLVTKLNSYSDFKLKYRSQDTDFVQLETEMEKDPWNTPFYILLPKSKKHPVYIVSHGADKERGTYSSGNFGDDLVLIIEKK